MTAKPVLCLVTPALPSANNGNWQTAARWARWLGRDYRVLLTQRWEEQGADLLIALHARRSADSIARWAGAHPQRPQIVVLTGTDLYRDIATDVQAQASLESASRLVVLNELGALTLPRQHREKAVVILQSAATRRTLTKPTQGLRALMVGHLRDEKSPQTYWAAAERLAARGEFSFDHIGAALDPALGERASALMRTHPRYRWLGALEHRRARDHIQRAHVLVHASLMEGGAHVVIEAVTSGTPVIASRIDGNIGLLGADYAGIFEPGDAAGLAAALERCRDDVAMLAGLRRQCALRAPLFEPVRERAALLTLIASTLEIRK